MVWPSVFDAREGFRPAWVGCCWPLWEDLRRLEEHCQAVEEVEEGKVALVAFAAMVGVCRPDERSALDRSLAGFYPDGRPAPMPAAVATPSTIDPDWEFLGFDVTDLAISGLTNTCFHSNVDVPKPLRARWGPHLNEHHLFEDLDQAAQFKELANREVPEHAPFFVVGLWLIGELGGMPRYTSPARANSSSTPSGSRGSEKR
jgi:hypothetical protein